jgi:hypothetical protein
MPREHERCNSISGAEECCSSENVYNLWMATSICPLAASGDCPRMANSPRSAVAFRARRAPIA